jgi:DNA-binding response OmpR family regulator
MRVLIIDDEADIADIVRRWLTSHHYSVDVAHDGTTGEDLAWSNEYDAIIMDVVLPGKNGKELCRSLRSDGITTPILLLTALDTPRDVIEGLDNGADDYLPKPFDFDVLLARLRALVRRQSSQRSSEIKIADLIVNTATRTVVRGQQPIQLTAKAFALLEYLALNKGRIITRDSIVEHMWNMNFDSRSNVIDALVYSLRSRIDKGFTTPLVHTIRGVGYYLDESAQM